MDRLALTTGAAEPNRWKRANGYRHVRDRFAQAGLTPVASDLVGPPRTAECPVAEVHPSRLASIDEEAYRWVPILSVVGASVRAVDDITVGADGRGRCGWAGATADYLAYHDDEWGVPQRDEVRLFEKLCLEAFQSGLSWLTILRKREAFRAGFAGFEPARVAGFGPADVERLLADRGIVRNRAKIEAAISNARAVLELPDGLSPLLWSFAPDPAGRPRPESFADVPATTPESTAMARDLRKRGFRFVGPTTAYALMQACGLVDDHLTACWRATAPEPAR